MLRQLLAKLLIFKSKLPLTYSLLLIILVPLTLVVNTWWNLRAFERDMNFAVREKALAINNTFTAIVQDDPIDSIDGVTIFTRLQKYEPNLIGATILTPDENGSFMIHSATNAQQSEVDREIPFNALAWTQDSPFLTETYDQQTNKNAWISIAPFYDSEGKKIGLINLRISAESVESIVNRTSRDALIILFVSVLVIVLLLINHLKLFESSLMVDKLKEIDQMKDDFISVASHELRTPLTAIKSCVSMIKEDYKNIPQEIEEWFNIIDQSVARLNNLVTDLLNISRIEQNRLDFNASPIDSSALIQDVLDQLQFSAKEKNLQLHFSRSEPIYIAANADRMREVLINLIGNSIKYTLQGSVTIEQTTEKGSVNILIKDTGIGIAPEDKERLFQKFSRIQTETTKKIPGTGLGLWITKTIVERMGGKIYIDSIINQGTVFTVVMKKTNPPESGSQSSNNPESSTAIKPVKPSTVSAQAKPIMPIEPIPSTNPSAENPIPNK